MDAYALTDPGIYRSMNQDTVFSTTAPVGPLENLFMVADGMGGHRAGDFASRFIVERLAQIFRESWPDKDVHSILREGIRRVNSELFFKASAEPGLSGAGSTLVLATVRAGVLYVANVGDSRLYLLRNSLEQITRDHSYVEELVALGQIKRGSRDYFQKKNIITRAVGVEQDVDIDLFALKVRKGDLILMCSDGLSNMVDELEIEYLIRAGENLEQKAKSLIEAANRNGGQDNISVVLVDPQRSEVRS